MKSRPGEGKKMKKKKKSGTRRYLSGTKGRELDNKGMLTI